MSKTSTTKSGGEPRNDPAINGRSASNLRAMDELLRGLRKKSKRPIAIFLGAGASKIFGYPITRDLMLKIIEGLHRGTILDKKAEGPGVETKNPRKELRQFLEKLLPGDRRSRDTVPMVTGVLSLLDFSLGTGQALLPEWTLEETRRMRQLLERALLEVIPDEVWFDAAEEKRFEQFQKCLGQLRDNRPGGGVGLITTNYDMVSDLAAICTAGVRGSPGSWSMDDLAVKVDYGFRWVRYDKQDETVVGRPEKPEVTLYKLHGSTNWLRCPLCENLYINPQGPISYLAGGGQSSAANLCHCSDTRLEAQIVSPSFVREMREPNLIAIWKNTLDLLRASDHWVIIGYSFPDEDVGIRALFTRAFGASKPWPRISVIQWNEDARINYESFFPSVTYLTGGLELLLERSQPVSSRKVSKRSARPTR